MAKVKGTTSKKSSSSSAVTNDAVPAGSSILSTESASPRKSSAPQQRDARPVTSEERYRLVAEAAYFRAEARGFQGGDPVTDWLEAEAEVNRTLLPQTPTGNSSAYESSRRDEASPTMPSTQKPSTQIGNRPRPS